jgi:hypothetical protein
MNRPPPRASHVRDRVLAAHELALQVDGDSRSKTAISSVDDVPVNRVGRGSRLH